MSHNKTFIHIRNVIISIRVCTISLFSIIYRSPRYTYLVFAIICKSWCYFIVCHPPPPHIIVIIVFHRRRRRRRRRCHHHHHHHCCHHHLYFIHFRHCFPLRFPPFLGFLTDLCFFFLLFVGLYSFFF